MGWKLVLTEKHFGAPVNVTTIATDNFLTYNGSDWVNVARSDFLLSEAGAPTSSVDFNSQKITGIAAGTTSGDGVEYAQFEAAINGLTWKEPVKAASTANVVIASGLENNDIIDGITLSTGDRVLLKDQSTNTENGVYVVVASGAASRAADMNSWDDHLNATVFVMEGSTQADYGFTCTADEGGTLGSTAIAFVQFNGGGIPGSHASTHQNGGADEISTETPGAYAIPKAGSGGTLATGWIPDLTGTYQPLDPDLTSWALITRAANYDTFATTPSLVNINALITDATLIDTADSRLSDARDPNTHAASHKDGGGDEIASVTPAANTIPKTNPGDQYLAAGFIPDLSGTYQPTDPQLTSWALITRPAEFDTFTATTNMANFDAMITDGSVQWTGEAPTSHAASHKDGAGDELLLNEFGEPNAAVPFAGQMGTDFVVHTVADNTARDLLTGVNGKLAYVTAGDDMFMYLQAS